MKKCLTGLICCLFFFAGRGYGQEKSAQPADCAQTFTQNGTCPAELCQLSCDLNQLEEGCVEICKPKDCPLISVEHCPTDHCQVMTGCEGQPICFFKLNEGNSCGELAYAEQDVPCCDGLKRRCGAELFDGSCDMAGKKSMYSVPICIPCGDGLCGQFENRCNCPEDCNKGAPYTGFEFNKIPSMTPASKP